MKSVFSVNVTDAESKRKVMKAVASLNGIDSLSVDLEKKQLTVVGTVDPVKVVHKLGKNFNPRIEKVEQDKKDGGTNKNPAEGSMNEIDKFIREHILANQPFYRGHWAPHWCQPVEEGPSGCVIS